MWYILTSKTNKIFIITNPISFKCEMNFIWVLGNSRSILNASNNLMAKILLNLSNDREFACYHWIIRVYDDWGHDCNWLTDPKQNKNSQRLAFWISFANKMLYSVSIWVLLSLMRFIVWFFIFILRFFGWLQIAIENSVSEEWVSPSG